MIDVERVCRQATANVREFVDIEASVFDERTMREYEGRKPVSEQTSQISVLLSQMMKEVSIALT